MPQLALFLASFMLAFLEQHIEGGVQGESIKKNVKMCPIKNKPEVAVGLWHMCGLLLPSVIISLLAEQ